VLTPLQTATLITGYAVLVQGYGAWKMRHATKWNRVWPFLIGGAPGVAVGVFVLHWADPATMRAGIGGFIVLFALYALARPTLKTVPGGMPADVGVGFLSGILGATTGFAGILIVVWCQMRGGKKDELRAIFQPVLFATFVMTTISFAIAGTFTVETLKLYAFALPVLVAGIWSGFGLYGKLDDAAFRKVILVLLLASGVALIVPMH